MYQASRNCGAANSVHWAHYFLQTASDESQWLYMLIDAAHDARIFPALEKSWHTRACLFSEDQVSSAIKSAAPFLVKIKKIDEFMVWCMQEGFNKHWMIFFTSPEIHVSEIKLHFKRFSQAYGPDGKQYFFRYYDPRVLPIFLAAAGGRDRTDFFRRCKLVWIPQVCSDGSVQVLKLDASCSPQVVYQYGEALQNISTPNVTIQNASI
ncbi:MAG: DUF4123 domain-containing protein [Cellvibrio sp.]